jgi:YfiH family protein|tara:strand:- start:5337 stop:6086 length:750 start_codon:yes stop_codon:yes gene_type:complete
MILSKKLFKTGIINHGFFNKKNGFSQGIYKSLNCGIGSLDNKKNVKKNLEYVKKKLLSNKKISLLYQKHSAKLYFIKKISKRKLIGDALITNIKNLPIGILTADCAPILILDPKKKIIAAVHAGWRGAYKNIVIKVLRKLVKLGSNKKDIIVAIGPCINQKNYEVGKEFKNKFLTKSSKNSIFFKKKKERIYFDLSKFIYNQLNSFGILKIDVIRTDTFDKKNNFFSARRSIKKNESDYGRNISVIMLK